jgi:hypothetical protein
MSDDARTITFIGICILLAVAAGIGAKVAWDTPTSTHCPWDNVGGCEPPKPLAAPCAATDHWRDECFHSAPRDNIPD